jgi:hypothetical protein
LNLKGKESHIDFAIKIYSKKKLMGDPDRPFLAKEIMRSMRILKELSEVNNGADKVCIAEFFGTLGKLLSSIIDSFYLHMTNTLLTFYHTGY